MSCNDPAEGYEYEYSLPYGVRVVGSSIQVNEYGYMHAFALCDYEYPYSYFPAAEVVRWARR
eukprot:scaffold60017_cov14-Prasinocladus_malaysianus.AAC.1